MDGFGKLLDYPDMTIPSYALYGEPEANQRQEWLHWETIQARSRKHDYRIAPHRHEAFFQLLQLTGGRAAVTIDGTAFDLRHPAIIVVPALTVHGYVFSADVDGIVLTLMERDVRAAGLSEPAALVLRGGDAVGAAMQALMAEADRPGIGHDVAMRSLIALLTVSIRRARQSLVNAPDAASDRRTLHARTFRVLVDQRFRETRTIADYAGAIGISPTHLNRVSRQMLGASALAVIERRVALEARRQLLFSSLTIKQIGAELGYEDPAYFTRFLTRMLGVAPGAYRAQAREMQATAIEA